MGGSGRAGFFHNARLSNPRFFRCRLIQGKKPWVSDNLALCNQTRPAPRQRMVICPIVAGGCPPRPCASRSGGDSGCCLAQRRREHGTCFARSMMVLRLASRSAIPADVLLFFCEIRRKDVTCVSGERKNGFVDVSPGNGFQGPKSGGSVSYCANISMDFIVKKKDPPCCEKNVFFDKASPA